MRHRRLRPQARSLLPPYRPKCWVQVSRITDMRQIIGQNAISASGQSCSRCYSSFGRSCIRARRPSARNGANHRAVTRGDPSVVEQQASVVGQATVEVAVAEFPSAAPGRFINGNTAFVQEFPVRGYEVSPNQRASMVTVANLLQVRTSKHQACLLYPPHWIVPRVLPQELAGNHAVGMWGRAEKGFASLPNVPDIIFVMTRLQIRMEQYPKVRGGVGVLNGWVPTPYPPRGWSSTPRGGGTSAGIAWDACSLRTCASSLRTCRDVSWDAPSPFSHPFHTLSTPFLRLVVGRHPQPADLLLRRGPAGGPAGLDHC